MKAILNETQVWYCDLCDETIDNISKSKYFRSRREKHNEEYGIIVKEFEIFKPKYMKKFTHLEMFLKIVEINFVIHLNIDVYMILISYLLQIVKKLF